MKWRSQDTNTRLHDLAEQLVSEFKALGGMSELPARHVSDHVVMPCHNRVSG